MTSAAELPFWAEGLRAALREKSRSSPSVAESGDPPGRMPASVAVVLRGKFDPELLLIRRAEAPGDPWSGHMALPGGRRDPSDADLLATAVRETLEETGVNLRKEGELLGTLEPVLPATRHLPPLVIHPFVFALPGAVCARPASPEVAETFWVSLSRLGCPSSAGTVEIPLGGGLRSFPCIRVGDHAVWGLTYRIVLELIRLIQGLEQVSGT